MTVERAAVVGAGTMGAEIVQVFADHLIPVVVKDVSQDLLDRGVGQVRAIFQRRVDRGRLSQSDAARRMAMVEPSLDYRALANADFIVEAVPERLDLKLSVYRDLDACAKQGAILATNTSSLSIAEIAAVTTRPEAVVGFHFFNPASVLKLIEVVASAKTSPAVLAAAVDLARLLDKHPVRVKECPGFLVNRILVAGLVEGLRYQQDTGAAIEQVDQAVKERGGVPMGPFRLSDLVGIDVLIDVADVLASAYGERFAMPAFARNQKALGRLGQKSGGGYFNPDGTLAVQLGQAAADPVEAGDRSLAAGFLEAFRCLDEGVATADDIDIALVLGGGYRQGPLAWGEEVGLDKVLALVDQLAAKYGERYAAPGHFRELVASAGNMRAIAR